MLKEGLIWRIGDGTNVRIWEDPWIPRGVTRRPASYQGPNLLTKVSELIDPNTGCWDRNLVSDCFHPDDVPIILSIPICEHGEDFMEWHFDSKGIFFVKPAYKIHVQMMKDEGGRRGKVLLMYNQPLKFFEPFGRLNAHQESTISFGD